MKGAIQAKRLFLKISLCILSIVVVASALLPRASSACNVNIEAAAARKRCAMYYVCSEESM